MNRIALLGAAALIALSASSPVLAQGNTRPNVTVNNTSTSYGQSYFLGAVDLIRYCLFEGHVNSPGTFICSGKVQLECKRATDGGSTNWVNTGNSC